VDARTAGTDESERLLEPAADARAPRSGGTGPSAVLPALLVVLAVLVAYAQAIGGPLVWDDRYLILDVPLVEHGAPIVEYLKRPLWSSGSGVQSMAYYRPLVMLSFALDHRLHGSNSGGYHLTNIALHALSALALFALLRRRGARPWSAGALAAGWALLPRLAEVGAWISGRADGLAGLFVLLALIVWGPSLARRGLASTLIGVGLLAKESAAAGVAALVCLEWAAARPLGVRQQSARVVRRVWPLLVALGAYLALRLTLIGYATESPRLGGWVRARSALEAIATYAGMLVDPLRSSGVIGRLGVITPLGTIAGGAVLCAALALTWRFHARLRETEALGLGLFVFGLLPVLHLLPIPLRTLAADRFLYLPTAGLAVALAPRLGRLLDVKPLARLAALGALGVLLAFTLRRVGVWSNEVDFWVDTYLRAPPTNHAAAVEFSGVYFRAGRIEEALELSERALRYDDPNKQNAMRNVAVCLTRLGRPDAAFKQLLASSGGQLLGDEARLAAVADAQRGHFEAARKNLERMERTDPVAKQLLVSLPALEKAHEELAKLGPDGAPVRRARLATMLGDRGRALPAWAQVTAEPAVGRATLLEGLQYLVQAGDRAALARATENYTTRFGPLQEPLGEMIDARLAELAELIAASRRLGLTGRN